MTLPELDESTIEMLAVRVAEALRRELQGLAAELLRGTGSERPLSVGEVAERFGVARSTVYAHWREWGGYKLGEGEKAMIRFRASGLPENVSTVVEREAAAAPRARPARGRRRRAVVRGEPRLPDEFDSDR